MTLYHALLLGLLQGATEFLPISSSGHLALTEQYLRLPFGPETLQRFDIILHAGSLLAILLYFYRTWWRVLRHPLRGESDGGPPLLLLLIIGTLPAAVIGFLLEDWISVHTRTPLALGIGFLVTGAFLLAGDYIATARSGSASVRSVHAWGMGIGQALALVPSISRSGMTLASGRLLGLSVVKATEFSFLLGAPALAGAILLTLLRGLPDLLVIGWPQLLTGFGASFVGSILTMHFFIACTKRYGAWMWAIYLFVIGVLVLGDEFLPILRQVQEGRVELPFSLLLTILTIALLLEAAPLSSLFVPGFMTMVAIGVLLQGDWLRLGISIIVGTIALTLGNLMGYIPAREARERVHWKEKTDKRLLRTERFFRKWGVLAVILGVWYGPTRSLCSIAAGLGEMPLRKYLLATTFSSLIWVTVAMGVSSYFGRIIW